LTTPALRKHSFSRNLKNSQAFFASQRLRCEDFEFDPPWNPAQEGLSFLNISGGHMSQKKSFTISAGAAGAVALGSFAIGAFAIGALAIGRLFVRRFAVQKGSLASLEIGELTVGRLKVKELQVEENLQLPSGQQLGLREPA
jgi:hypothetical protein